MERAGRYRWATQPVIGVLYRMPAESAFKTSAQSLLSGSVFAIEAIIARLHEVTNGFVLVRRCKTH